MNSTAPDYFDRLLVEVYPSAIQFARRLTHDTDAASDIVQQAALRAVKAKHTYRYPERYAIHLFRKWFNAIIFSVFIDDSRAKKVHLRNAVSLDAIIMTGGENLTLADSLMDETDMVRDTISDDAANRIVNLIKTKLPKYWPVLRPYFNGHTYEEISQIANVPAIGTVRSRIHRGKKLAQNILIKAHIVAQ